MMELWSGSLPAIDNLPPLEDLHFTSPHRCPQLQFAPKSSLQFLSFVDVNKIPLYLSVGTSLEVWTRDQKTALWIEDVLTSSLGSLSDQYGDSPWPGNGSIGPVLQSQIGILLEVRHTTQDDTNNHGIRITELVLYGVISQPEATTRTPPSPPWSSSPTHGPGRGTALWDLEVFALPISSDLLYTPLNTNIQALASGRVPSERSEESAQFLPRQHSPLKKRKRAAALLDDAIERKKNINRKGGDGVGLLVTSSLPSQHVPIKKESVDMDFSSTALARNSPNQYPKAVITTGLEASPPVDAPSRRSSVTPTVNERISTLSRPPSRKRSSLHRVSSSISRGPGSPVPIDDPPPSDSMIEQNKSLLSRIVLAGMRLYGLSRNREQRPMSASVSSASMADASLPASGSEYADNKDVDEFKAVYHATYRAAAFALRKSLKTEEPLEKDRARFVVDQLLAMFCVEQPENSSPAEEPQS